jgi:hypothetical protein
VTLRNQAISLDEKEELYRYHRAQTHYLLHHESAFQQDMEAAIELGKQTHSSSDDVFHRWRWDFNLAMFALFLRNDPETQHFYEQLIATCPFIMWYGKKRREVRTELSEAKISRRYAMAIRNYRET